MYQFFIEPENIKEEEIHIVKEEDIRHIRNVLRMKEGERLCLCCPQKSREYVGPIREISPECIRVAIEDINGESGELPVKITLFQGLPKGDKMEWIIQKAVELGVHEIVPVATKRSVVKLDARKAAKKTARWNEIAKSAAKQSKRGRIPEVKPVMTYGDAVSYGQTLSMLLLPYEDARGISHARKIVESVKGKESLGIFIGPEGGFPEEEVNLAREAGAQIITLGHRILRTETAGMTLLSILMFLLEED
ncbi:MAG: 16S rRNA (uracil(1498)-N(3))-methyltransferase [Eubacterium sp.]|nr:16S rRNA (uracil(1498)-N(3))-methyltransferase [Eubacterium sp.]MDD7209813.1 16S rRNA (uracil(1498)-N(3))-methyltransferase [Lachnospiraceae bacterium]MDY5497687.1 16S rRNA (uracil(1498)-N(3))-methyltransferase [Anaerobutyricum sp.]